VASCGALFECALKWKIIFKRGETLSFPIPTNNRNGAAALRALDILDTAPDVAYDEIGKLASHTNRKGAVCTAPFAD
jgi:hypothetical protein